MTTIPRARSLQTGRNIQSLAAVEKSVHIQLPARLAEVRSQEPASLVFQYRINTDSVFSRQMVMNDLASNRQELPVLALGTLHTWFATEHPIPLISAGG